MRARLERLKATLALMALSALSACGLIYPPEEEAASNITPAPATAAQGAALRSQSY